MKRRSASGSRYVGSVSCPRSLSHLIHDVRRFGSGYMQGWVEYQDLDLVQDQLRAAGYGVSVQRGEEQATVSWWRPERQRRTR